MGRFEELPDGPNSEVAGPRGTVPPPSHGAKPGELQRPKLGDRKVSYGTGVSMDLQVRSRSHAGAEMSGTGRACGGRAVEEGSQGVILAACLRSAPMRARSIRASSTRVLASTFLGVLLHPACAHLNPVPAPSPSSSSLAVPPLR